MTTKILKTTGGIYNETPEKTGRSSSSGRSRLVPADSLRRRWLYLRRCNQDLDAAINGKWGQLSSSFTFKSHTDLKNGKFGYTFIAKCDYKNTDLAKLIKTDTNINSHYMDKWSDVGVVVRTVDGQTYIAISVAIDTSKT